MPVGKRPRPPVASGKKPRFNTDNTGMKSGTRGSKSPTGSRPTPPVAKSSTPGVPPTNKVRPAGKYTPMPTPNRDHGTRGGGKPHGGA